jgi:hypothetical protein
MRGVDLERASRESLSRPQLGEEVGVRAVKREPVTVKSRRESGESPAVENKFASHRNRWIMMIEDDSVRSDPTTIVNLEVRILAHRSLQGEHRSAQHPRQQRQGAIAEMTALP